MKRVALLPALLAAGLLAGCGSSGAPSAPIAPGAPSTPRGMSVGITDGHLGGAITESSDGRERRLAPRSAIDPAVLRPKPNAHEGIAAGDSCANADLLPSAANLQAITAATLCLVNGERADRGLRALSTDADLAQAAMVHGGDMVERGYFAHDGRDGSKPADRIRRAGYLSGGGAWQIGENLAWGTGDLSTPRSIMAAWMSSPGHRANILEPDYKEIGVALVAGNPNSRDGSGATFVTEFGVVEKSAQSASRRARQTHGAGERRKSEAHRSAHRRKHRSSRAKAKLRARMRARRSRARRARAALAPRSRRGRVVGRVSRAHGGLN
jgi:uncharacterized protein YkwD